MYKLQFSFHLVNIQSVIHKHQSNQSKSFVLKPALFISRYPVQVAKATLLGVDECRIQSWCRVILQLLALMFVFECCSAFQRHTSRTEQVIHRLGFHLYKKNVPEWIFIPSCLVTLETKNSSMCTPYQSNVFVEDYKMGKKILVYFWFFFLFFFFFFGGGLFFCFYFLFLVLTDGYIKM